MIKKGKFGSYDSYTLTNECLEATIITLGATVISLKFKGQEMTRGYLTAEAALEGNGFLFKSVGRYANRIGGAAFELDGVKYVLPANEGKNQLHGGPNSYDKRVWNAQAVAGTGAHGIPEEKVIFSIFSPDGDDGFPGNLTMTVTFSLCGSALHIDFGGETDKKTVYAPTVHPYFNLGCKGSVLDADMIMKSTGHLEVDAGLIPTGKILPCEGDFDFSAKRPITRNFDDCFICPEELCCTLEMNGYKMDVLTDMPAIQVYTGIGMPKPYAPNDGIAIEPEFFPDSPNHPDFPSTVLNPGDHFNAYVDYRFSEV